MAARLRLSARRQDGTVTVAVGGEVDIATAPELKSYLDKILLADPRRVVLNLSGIPFIDAAGLGALVQFKERAERQRTALLLADVPAAVLRLLRLTKLDGHFGYLSPPAQIREPQSTSSGLAAQD
jgi:anti-sigma B factor antagonist